MKKTRKKKRSEMSFSELLQDTIDRDNKRKAKSIALFKAAQARSGKSGSSIDIMDLLK